MAEEDVALAAIRIKADGIEVLDIVDSKYKNLGSTMAKGKKRAEGNAEAMEKLRKISEKSAKSTQNNSVKNIESLMIMEAATSATNQLISARYKEIDSKLASGEITAEEAEELRKSVKQQEKYSSALEKTIAMLRFYKVAQYAAAAAVNVYTAATIKNTKAVAANTAALLANPFVFVTLGLVGLAMVLKGASKEFGLLADQLEFVGEKLKPVTESIDALVEGLDTVIGTDIANNKIFEALITE
tara:strand:- start:256 stop:984 length:729 start_codon:yes stop_codon:yes gene_type:complete